MVMDRIYSPSKDDSTGALDIIIECPVGISISVQIVEGLFAVKVFELDDHVGIHLLHGIHEFIHECLLLLKGNSPLAQAQVEGILEIGLVVGASIQDDGQSLRGVNTSGRNIQSQFTDLQESESANGLHAPRECKFPNCDLPKYQHR